MNTIKEFRRAGHKVKVFHRRLVKILDLDNLKVNIKLLPLFEIRTKKLQKHVLANGGETEIFVTTKDGEDYRAATVCSKSDSWNRKTANRIVLGRIVKMMENKG